MIINEYDMNILLIESIKTPNNNEMTIAMILGTKKV